MEQATLMTWFVMGVLPTLAVAAITGYIKLAFGSISKDVKKAAERSEQALLKIESAVSGQENRLQKVEQSQAYREGREAERAVLQAVGGRPL